MTRQDQIRPGYKQTEVGVIPEDWEVRRFSEHFTIYAGGDVPKHSLSQIRSEFHPFPIFANAIKNKGLYGYTNEMRSSADSITITARGYLGHAEYRNERFFPIVRLLVLEPSGSLDAKFTMYAINDRVEFAIESTGVPQLTAPQVGKYAVGAPIDLHEQKLIAAALSDADRLIAALEALIAKKRDLKQAAMQQLLTGKTRLPGVGPSALEYKQTEVGVIPKDWDVVRLGKVGGVIRGASPRPKGDRRYYGGPIPRLMVEDVTRDRNCLINTVDSLTIEGAKRSRPCPAGTLTIVCSGTVGITSILAVDACIHDGFLALVDLQSGVSTDFVFHLLNTQQEKFDGSATHGGVFTNLTTKILENFAVALPSKAEQTAIAEVLSDMDTDLTALETQRDKAKEIKQGMMQELLTGKVRLI